MKWSMLWKVDEATRPTSWESESLSGKDLEEAARRFRVGTSNIEGIGPGHIGSGTYEPRANPAAIFLKFCFRERRWGKTVVFFYIYTYIS